MSVSVLVKLVGNCSVDCRDDDFGHGVSLLHREAEVVGGGAYVSNGRIGRGTLSMRNW